MDPFETLLDIERNCRAFAVNIPRQAVRERDWVGVRFRASNFNFVCPLYRVTEILKFPLLTEVPAAQPWFKGSANLRGHILPVTDLQGFITGKVQLESSSSRIMVISFGKALYGFLVEQVVGITRFFSEEIKPTENKTEMGAYLPYIQGGFESDRQAWMILNFDKVIQNPEFYHIITVKTENIE